MNKTKLIKKGIKKIPILSKKLGKFIPSVIDKDIIIIISTNPINFQLIVKNPK